MPFSSRRCEDICVAWRKALRRLWTVPYRTHSRLLAILSGTLPLEMSLEKRFVKFARNVLNHDTGIVRSVASLSLCNPWSTFNRNYGYICQSYGPNLNVNNVMKMWYDSIDDIERADVSVLNDVIDIRDGYKHCDLSPDEIFLTIDTICTN